MGIISKTIEIIFSGVDELSGPINTISSKLDSFSGQIESMANPFADAADAVLAMDAALVGMAAGGLLVAFNKSMEFESAVIELKKVLGEGAGVDAAIAEAMRLSDVYGQSASDILLSTAAFKQAGYDIADALSLTADGLDLVIAGNIDAAQSSDLIISALKGFGLEADSARRYIDILNEVSNNYATDVEQLATGLSKISPIASQMGFSMEEMAGLLVPVIEVFRSGDEAAIALKTGLLKLIDDSKPVSDALTAIGVSQRTANGELRSGRDIYLDVAKAFKTLDEDQKLFITSQLVGIEQSAKMVKVFDNLALATEIAGVAMGSAGSAAAEVAKRLASSEVAVDRFKVGFENLATTVGDQFRLATVEAIDGGTDIENALSQIIKSGTFKPIIDELNSFSSDMGSLLSSIAKNLPEAFEGVDFSGLMDSVGDIGDALGGLFDGIDLSTPKGLEDVIQKVVDTLGSLASVTAGMINKFKPFATSILGMVDSFNSMDGATKQSAGEILALSKVVASAGLEVAVAILALSGYAEQLGPAFTVAIKTIAGAFDSLAVVFNGLSLVFLELVEDLLQASLLLTKLPGFGALGDDVEANIAIVQQWKDKFQSNMFAAADSATKNLTGMETNFKGLGKAADEVSGEVKKVPEEIDKIPDEKKTDIAAEIDDASMANAKTEMNDAVPDKKITDAKLSPDTESINKTKKDYEQAAPFQKITEGVLNPDSPSISKTKSVINDAVPESKLMEIQLQGDIDTELARIEAGAENLQAAFEYQAKVDVAEIEAFAETTTAAFDSVGTAIDATAAAAADMFGSLLDNWDDLSWWDQDMFTGMVQAQLDMEERAIISQEALVAAQVSYMESRTSAMNSGSSLISITSDGLEPILEELLWNVMEKVKLRATGEAAEFLFGLGGVL